MKTVIVEPNRTNMEWTLEDCSNGGAIVCMGDSKNIRTQRLQVFPKENAELIVKAVNMHNELVERLKSLTQMLKDNHCEELPKSITSLEDIIKRASAK